MLRSAMEIIAEKGATGATLAEIGVAAGYSRGLPVERFGSKLGLLNALMDFMEDWFARRVQKAVEGKSGMAAVRARINAHIDSACESPPATAALYSIFVDSICALPELQPRTQSMSESYHRGFRQHLEEARRDGELRRDVDCGKAACVIVGVLRGLIIQSLLDGGAAHLTASRAQLISMVEVGLANNAAPTRKRRTSLERRRT